MEAQIGNVAGLDCAYFLAFGVGLLWAIVILVAGGLGGDVDVPDADVPDFDVGDVDAFDVGSVDVSPISPITISAFITAFGAVGIISRQLFGISGPVSLLWANSRLTAPSRSRPLWVTDLAMKASTGCGTSKPG